MVNLDAVMRAILLLSPLLVIGGMSAGTWLILKRVQCRRNRVASSYQGNCGGCGYQPATGTPVCPECGGAVLDTRLFRPLNGSES